jgi:hypothetical protein
MSILERRVITLRTGEQLDGSYTSFEIWCMVIEVDGIVDGHGPERFVFFLRPMEGLVDHLSPSFVHSNLDTVFSWSILPFCSNTAELDGLVAVGKGLLECF